MPIEIRELVIRASVDRDISKLNGGYLERREKEKLKQEILAYCISEIKRPIEKKLSNPINR